MVSSADLAAAATAGSRSARARVRQSHVVLSDGYPVRAAAAATRRSVGAAADDSSRTSAAKVFIEAWGNSVTTGWVESMGWGVIFVLSQRHRLSPPECGVTIFEPMSISNQCPPPATNVCLLTQSRHTGVACAGDCPTTDSKAALPLGSCFTVLRHAR